MTTDDLFSLAAAERDRQLRERDLLPRARAAWMAEPRRKNAPWRERMALGGYALAGAAAGAAALWMMTATPASLHYETVGLVRSVEPAGEVMRPQEKQGEIRFSDGSVVTMERGAQAGVNDVRERGAAVRLDRGRLTADIVHRAQTRWRFQAGEFEVLVTGTRFDLSWDDATAELTLRMTDGSVRLQGCGMAPRAVSQGESIQLRCSSGHAMQGGDAAPASSDPVAPAGPADSTPAIAAASAASRPAPSGEGPEDTEPETSADWRASLKAGRLREAWLAAESVGFADTCQSASGPELLALADAASNAGHADRASMALLAARRRFPGTQASSLAAFRLGRLAFSGNGGSSEARRWLTTYLRESPGGGLREEALGRLLELELRSGNLDAARARAAEYLRSYPSGPYAERARSLSDP